MSGFKWVVGRSQKQPKPWRKRQRQVQCSSRTPYLEILEDRTLLSAGALDPTFGNGGVAVTPMNAELSSMALQSDGKVVLAGVGLPPGSTAAGDDFVVARYTTSGSLDPTFEGGEVFTAVNSPANQFPPASGAFGVATQSDGDIVVAGASLSGNPPLNLPFNPPNPVQFAYSVARYTPSGALDPTFGDGGETVTLDLGDQGGAASAVAVQSDGKIIVGGLTTLVSGGVTSPVDYTQAFAMARYTTNGVLDPTFGVEGEVVNPNEGLPVGIATESDGSIIVATGGGLARYTTAGYLDPTFGAGGQVVAPGFVSGMAIQSDGDIVVTSSIGFSGQSFALERYTPAGVLDATFGNSGEVIVPFHTSSVAIQSNGDIVVAGSANNNIALARYTPSSALDSTFGNGGEVVTSFGSSTESVAVSVAVQKDGNIVVAGAASQGSFPNVANYWVVARYIGSVSQTVTPSLSWDSTQGGVDVGYTVSDTLSQSTTVDLYWASGDQFSNVIGGPITGASQVVAAGTTAGSYGPFYIDDATLGTPPPGATYLLAVADPNNVLGTFNPSTNVASIAVPTWTGAGATDLWSDGGNWRGGVAPTAGADLVFPTGALQETSVNDLGFTFGSIITSDAYSFSGQPITASSIKVVQGTLELDSPTTVTNTLSVAANTTLIEGSGSTPASFTVPDNATFSLAGRLIVNAMATLQDDGTVSISSEGVMDDFGTVNVGKGGNLTGSQGLLLIAPSAILSNSGTLNISNDASLADEGTLSVINSGTFTNSGSMSVGTSDGLSISNGTMTQAPGAAMDVEGNITVNPEGALTIDGYLDLDGIDDGLDMPGDGLLISTPVTSITPTSTKAEEIAHQVAAIDALPFETIKVLAENAANQSAGDIVVIQGAEKLASWADKASYFGITTEYSSDISSILKAYNNNDSDTFAVKYSQLVEHMVGDLASATAAAPLQNKACEVDNGLGTLALNVMGLISGFVNKQQAENYYENNLASGVTAEGLTVYNALKTRSSTAGPGVGGTLNDQGSVTVGPTGTFSDQDSITIGTGVTLNVFGSLIEGATGAQQVFGTLVIEPSGILDIIGSLSVEPGGSFVPLGTVSIAPGGIANLPSGVSAYGTNLFIVGGTTTNDLIQVKPFGTSQTGSTGLQVNALLNGMVISSTFNQSFSSIYIIGYAGNENVILSGSLSINSYITAGNGNDNVIADNNHNSVTLGNGNDNVVVENGNNFVTLGNGNDNIFLGNGNNIVMLGNGNDNSVLGNGNNILVEGSGHDNIIAGNGDNLIVAGLGQHTVLVGNGSNILIDGSVQLTQIGDSLPQVLSDWIKYGTTASNVASIRSRLAVTYNSNRHNTLLAGTDLDWFFVTYAGDTINRKQTDLLN